MKTRFKIIFATLICLFIFCIGFYTLNVKADATVETTEQVNTVGVYEYNEEGKGTAKFTLYSDYTFTAELHDLETGETLVGNGTYTLENDILVINVDNGVLKFDFTFKVTGNKLEPYTEPETSNDYVIEPNSFLDRLRYFKWEDFETVVIGLASYLGFDFILKIISAVIVIIFKLKKDEKILVLKESAINAEVEHRKNEESLERAHNEELSKLTNMVLDIKTEVKEFMSQQTEKIESLTNDKTKAIAEELTQVTEMLK